VTLRNIALGSPFPTLWNKKKMLFNISLNAHHKPNNATLIFAGWHTNIAGSLL
jgi:hypothetical protein